MSSMNVLMIRPDSNGDNAFQNSDDHACSMAIYALEKAAQNLLDVAKDRANRDYLQRNHSKISVAQRDFNEAIELMWRPR